VIPPPSAVPPPAGSDIVALLTVTSLSAVLVGLPLCCT
jgi:hypothetical protein